ncbi:hypothetical protein MN116_000271, partial [Schistosoma mekongi]
NKVTLLILFYIDVCLMAMQASTQNTKASKHLAELKNEIEETNNSLNEYTNCTEYSQSRLSKLADEAINQLNISNGTMTTFVDCERRASLSYFGYWTLKDLKYKLEDAIRKYGKYNVTLAQLWRERLDGKNRTFIETQSNGTVQNCSELLPRSGYDLEPLEYEISRLEECKSMKNYYLFAYNLVKDLFNVVKRQSKPVTA